MRQVLVIIQFSIAMIMLICTMVVFGQLTYIRNKDLGFNQAQVVTVPVNTNQDAKSQIIAFTDAVRKDPRVLSVSTSQAIPGDGVGLNLFSVETKKGYIEQGVNSYGVDENYFNTL